jgi:adenylate cyclase
MSSKEIDRKLAVIFATDVVGYSKLMGNDEDHTIKAIRACKEILETLLKCMVAEPSIQKVIQS